MTEIRRASLGRRDGMRRWRPGIWPGALSVLLWQHAAAAPEPQALIRDGSFTTSDAAQIHYLHAGQQTSHPSLILIPGWTLTASLWKEQLQSFSRSRLVIAVDSRSQGQSSRMETGNTPERRARDLHELTASLNLGPRTFDAALAQLLSRAG